MPALSLGRVSSFLFLSGGGRMAKFKKLLAFITLTLGLLSCHANSSSSDALPPEYEGDIEFSLPVEPGQVSKWNTTFSVRTSYFVTCDIPCGYRLPDDLYWEYEPGYLHVYGDYPFSLYNFVPPHQAIGHEIPISVFSIFFIYPGETTIALKQGEETLFSLDVRIIDGTVKPLGFEESLIYDYGEDDDYMLLTSPGQYEKYLLPSFARDDDYFQNNLLLFFKTDWTYSLGYPFIIGDNFYFHCLLPDYRQDPYFQYRVDYYVMGMPKSYFQNPLIHYSPSTKFIPNLLTELN